MSVHEVDICSTASTINELTVELLEQALAHAKSGRMQEVLIIGFLENEDISTSYTPTLNFIRRLGAIEWIKLRWNNQDLT